MASSLTQDEARRPGRDLLFGLAWSCLGGVLGIIGAFIGEAHASTTPNFFLLGWFAAPIIEELMKPFGLYILLARWPHIIESPVQRSLLVGFAGLLFGIVEAVVYVAVYVDDLSTGFVIYRFTGPIVLHTVSAAVMGLAVTQPLLDAIKGRGPIPWEDARWAVAAFGLHSAYNRTATIIAFGL